MGLMPLESGKKETQLTHLLGKGRDRQDWSSKDLCKEASSTWRGDTLHQGSNQGVPTGLA